MFSPSKYSKKSTESIESATSEKCSHSKFCESSEDLITSHESREDSQTMRDLVSNSQFKWNSKFQTSLCATVIETNFESMAVLLHYGNLELRISAIFTHLEESLFANTHFEKGAFGVVKFCQFEGQDFAIKWIQFKQRKNEVDIESIYKEYFMCCLADALEVGPKMLKLFGYDIIVSRRMGFFSKEKCTQPHGDSKLIRIQLLSNLKTLHSIKFIHQDIKPENIAYSSLRNKHVFIDFGLSKLISETPDEKSSTCFEGTLSYCSEQMKRCWILNKPMLVNLYENDMCCLNNSIARFQAIQQEETMSEEQKQSQFGLLQQLALILKLKFYIEKEDCSEVTKLLQSCSKILKSVYQIFLTSSIPKAISENIQVQEKLSEITKQIAKQIDKSDSTDNLLCTAFSQSSQKQSAQKIIPISHLLQLSAKLFVLILSKTQMVYKMFIFFDPFSRKNTMTSEVSIKEKKKLVFKICEANQQNEEKSMFFCQKLRSVLIFFYDRLIELKNIKVMTSLRMLFISVEDWDYVEKLEDQIICSTDSPRLKMLRIAEFSLFWDLLFQDFDHKRKEKWRQIVTDTEATEATQKKVKELCELLVVDNKYFSYSEEFKNSAIVKILELGNHFSENEEKECLYNITYMYSEITKIHFSLFTSAPRGLTLRIYSRFFILFAVGIDKSEQLQEQILRPLLSNFHREFTASPSKTLALNAIRHQFEIKKTNSYINPLFFRTIKAGFIYGECCQELIRQIKNMVQNTTQYDTCYSLFSQLLLIQSCIYPIKFNRENAILEERISRIAEVTLMKQISTLLNKALSNQSARKILSWSNEVRISVNIIEIELAFCEQKPEDQIRSRFEETVKLLSPLPYKFPNFIHYFSALFYYLQKHLHQKQDHYAKRILVELSESYIEKKQFYIFENMMPMLSFYIKIKNQQHEQYGSDNLAMMLSFFEYFRVGKQFFANGLHNQTVVYATEVFCTTLATHKLEEVYSRVKFNKLESVCGLYGYFVFWVFLCVEEKFDVEAKRKQVVRTTLCCPRMSRFCERKVKPKLLKLSRKSNLYLTKRKAYICCKKQGKVQSSEAYKQLQQKITRKQKQSSQKTLSKIGQLLKKHSIQTSSLNQNPNSTFLPMPMIT